MPADPASEEPPGKTACHLVRLFVRTGADRDEFAPRESTGRLDSVRRGEVRSALVMHRGPLFSLGLAAAAITAGPAGVRMARADDPSEKDATDETVHDPSGEPGLDAYQDADPSALTDFQSALEPYGTWGSDGAYGTVWTPNPSEVGSDFAPYVSGGHWAYENDYVWVSDYAWGWAAFHYGRWVWTDRGWAWIPGRLYADAWVVWRVSDDGTGYVGWAPTPPTWGWLGGIAVRFGFIQDGPFFFCPAGDLFAPSLAPSIVSGPSNAAIAPHTRLYVRASPVVGPPLVGPSHGPPPGSLGIDVARVVHVTRTNPALLRARQFARPSTAQPLGARLPAAHVPVPRPVARPYPIPRAVDRSPKRR